MDPTTVPAGVVNPFAALTFIVAPALLPNASSLLLMGTTNRLARAVDRVRELASQLEHHARGEQAIAEVELWVLRFSIGACVIGVAAIMSGSLALVFESRITFRILTEEARQARERYAKTRSHDLTLNA